MRISEEALAAARRASRDSMQRSMQHSILPPTPGQTIGPFFGYDRGHEYAYLPFPDGQHLVPPGSPGAIQLSGVVYDGAGEPVPDAMLEIWQPDGDGNVSRETGSLARDGWTFTGWGRAATDATGRYSFSTVNPGIAANPGDGGTRDGEGGSAARVGAPFIHLVVFARGLLNKLHTRIYLPEHTDLLEADPLLASLTPEERQTLIGRRDARGNLGFDVVLQGRPGGPEPARTETVFLQFPGMTYPSEPAPTAPGKPGSAPR